MFIIDCEDVWLELLELFRIVINIPVLRCPFSRVKTTAQLSPFSLLADRDLLFNFMADFHKLTLKFFIVVHLDLLTNGIPFTNKFFKVLVFPEWNPTVPTLSEFDISQSMENGCQVGLLPVDPREVFYFPPTTLRKPMEASPIRHLETRPLGVTGSPRIYCSCLVNISTIFILSKCHSA
ncbi:hypothetical protein CDAR_303481 [Caerostris darwini]|uniref:Uncharacterized protein n=1 Tax=Caerostris darwini TaxID=1538125 RepID=A0AAV4NJX9_9ARAC|nr:hypothetical protein CDAR_303481 [Caerostris darwini]